MKLSTLTLGSLPSNSLYLKQNYEPPTHHIPVPKFEGVAAAAKHQRAVRADRDGARVCAVSPAEEARVELGVPVLLHTRRTGLLLRASLSAFHACRLVVCERFRPEPVELERVVRQQHRTLHANERQQL